MAYDLTDRPFDNLRKDQSEVDAYITSEDVRYPTLVIKGTDWINGYAVNKDTGELRRICICAAHSSTECMCGAWDGENS
jgi:hypothetical protein